MIPSNGQTNSTLYEQVLDFARKEIEDASSQMEELRRALHLVEARVEAAKSVYESVAARLNLEDELEDEAQLDHTKFPTLPSEPPQTSTPPPAPPEPQQAPPPVQSAPPQPVAQTETPRVEPPVFAPEPQQAPEPPPVTPKASEPPVFAPEPADQTPSVVQPPEPPPAAPKPSEPQQPAAAPAASNGNGSADGFSMDLIRKHLEAREKAAQAASQAPTRRSAPQPETPTEESAEQPAAQPAQAQAPSPPPPPAQKPATETPAASQPAQGGFPGLSEADRALIGEYLRSKRDG